MNLNTVVSVLVGKLTAHAFAQRGEGVSQFSECFLFGTFFRSQFALLGNVVQCFVNVYETGCLVQQWTGSIQFGFHQRKHFGHGGEFDDCLTELFTIFGISQSFIVSSLWQSYRLSGNTQAGTVHQRHYIFDQTQFAVTAKFGLGIFIYQLAGRRAFDTHFVLNTAYVYSTIALVVDEHGKTASVVCSFFRTCQYEVNIGITVCDEAFHSVQIPALVFFTVSGFQHDRLEIGTCIRFRQVHWHGFTLAYAGDITLLLFFVGKFVNGFSTILQSPQVLETGITAAHDIGSHDVRSDREVQASKAAGHSHAHQPCFAAGIQVTGSPAGIGHTIVGADRAFMIDTFCIGSDDVTTDFSYNFQHFVVAVHCVFEVYRSIVEFIFISIVALFQLNNSLHQRMVQVMLEFRSI